MPAAAELNFEVFLCKDVVRRPDAYQNKEKNIYITNTLQFSYLSNISIEEGSDYQFMTIPFIICPYLPQQTICFFRLRTLFLYMSIRLLEMMELGGGVEIYSC